jgi:2-octaprenyl-6-methoxyphenol hydroxylase
MSDISNFDAAVVGAGPAGLATGLALAEMGFKAAVIGPPADPRDGRSAALFQGSADFLKRLGVWPLLFDAIEPLDAIRLVDATRSLFRAPEVTFRAHEIGHEAFGYNVPNAALTAALETVAGQRLTRIVTPAVTEIDIADDAVTLTASDGRQFRAPLVAAADGRGSTCRAAAGISTRQWAYDQAAVVCTFSHSRPHKRISTEFHRRAGPLTLVPGLGNTSNVVWVEAPVNAKRILDLPDKEFADELGRLTEGLLGVKSQFSPRRMFPLSGQTASTLAQNRVALIGEAGHVIPPIGAQGLNLSFRDAATLAECAANTKAADSDIGGVGALQRYAALRGPDITSRVWTVDLLNRSLLSPFTPVHFLRGLGLFALSTVAPLRHRVMQEGIAPPNSTPKLMQPGLPSERRSGTP